jgi:hypothetical protein
MQLFAVNELVLGSELTQWIQLWNVCGMLSVREFSTVAE